MKKHANAEVKRSSAVLNLAEADVAPFVEKWLRDRSMSKGMADLNKDLLFGNQSERDAVFRAIKRIGFM